MNCPTKSRTKAIVYSCCWWAWVGLVRLGEQCRPEAWAVRGKASMPEAPLSGAALPPTILVLVSV